MKIPLTISAQAVLVRGGHSGRPNPILFCFFFYLEKLAADQNRDGSANHIGTAYRRLAVGLRQGEARPSDVWNSPELLSHRINCSPRI